MASEEITAAMLWLASDAARFVTGAVLPADAAYTIKQVAIVPKVPTCRPPRRTVSSLAYPEWRR